MTRPASKVLARGSAGEALVHLVVLSLLFVLAVTQLDFALGGLACLVVGAAYVAWNALAAKAAVTAASGTGSWIARAVIGACFVLMHVVLGLTAAGIAIALVIYVSSFFTRTFDIISILPPELGFVFVVGGAIHLLMAAGFALFCVAAFESAGFEPWSATRRRLSNRWLAAALAQMVIALPAGLALYALAAVIAAGPSLVDIASSMNLSWGHTTASVLSGYPTLLYLLLGAAVALAPHRGLVFRYAAFVNRVRGEGAGEGGGRRRAAAVPLVALLVIGGLAAALGNAKLIRVGYVAASSGVGAIGHVFDADQAIRDWVAAAIDEGTGAQSVAARLNDKGQWSSADPDRGLAELLPELGAKLAAMDEVRCSMAVAAGTLSAEDRAALAGLDSEIEPVAIKYCLRAVCRARAVAEEDAVTWMFSSHPSKREGWAEATTTTILFNKIHAAGGFCTLSGDLAPGYQG